MMWRAILTFIFSLVQYRTCVIGHTYARQLMFVSLRDVGISAIRTSANLIWVSQGVLEAAGAICLILRF